MMLRDVAVLTAFLTLFLLVATRLLKKRLEKNVDNMTVIEKTGSTPYFDTQTNPCN